MAKKTSSLPTIEEHTEVVVQNRPVEVEDPTIRTMELEIPMAPELPDEIWKVRNIGRRLDVMLTWQQAKKIDRMAEGLRCRGEKLKTGRGVMSIADVVRWLLDHHE